MLGPLVKAQLVALLTKKLLDSPAFHRLVGATHAGVSELQRSAYDALERAVANGEDKIASPSSGAQHSASHSSRPTPPPPYTPPPRPQRSTYSSSSTSAPRSSSSRPTPTPPPRPDPSQPLSEQNDNLQKFIERTKRALEAGGGGEKSGKSS